MSGNRYVPTCFKEAVLDCPWVWAPLLIGIGIILLFAAAPAAFIVLLNEYGWEITPICWVYFVLAAGYIGFCLWMLIHSDSEVTDGDPSAFLAVIFFSLFIPVLSTVLATVCSGIGAWIIGLIMPGAQSIRDLMGGRDFLLYPGMAFRNAGFVMVPFVLFSLLALLWVFIQWLNRNR